MDIDKGTIPVTILKPIFGTYVSIDYRILKRAVQEHKLIKLTLLGIGSCIVDPKVWYSTAKKIEKRKINYKTPMQFVYNFANIPGRYLQAKKHESQVEQPTLFR